MEIFNSPVELGARIVLLLDRTKGKFGLDELIFFDYAMIHSTDFDGAINVHPSLPNQLGELVRRRDDFPAALKMFMTKGLITSTVDEHGICYSITEGGSSLCGQLTTDYHQKVRRQASWLLMNLERLRLDKKRIFTMERAAS
jgi:hypothetical protein